MKSVCSTRSHTRACDGRVVQVSTPLIGTRPNTRA
ncbi:hypothetical protein F383_24215 [Gossypium arboreum]|uniref:Uncharacterized protein n=1 Tax=Gossypium arboreum TaxID=29729 RepID=A0A0B0P8M9_GOSAR|nr:hypothetical protein F383_24215 [Gossypium arboreum]